MKLFSKLSAFGALVIATSVALTGCATGKSGHNNDSTKSGKEFTVVATTGYLGDAVVNVAPNAKVNVLVAPGGDPHTQELTTADIEAVDKADLVVWTSHDMEHKMMGHLEKLGSRQLAAGEAIPEDKLLPWEEDGKIVGHDPHVWNSPTNWQYVVSAIGEKFAELDPDNAGTYRANAKAYNEKISAADKAAAEKLSKIPQERRVLITGHDAFNYLGKTYNLEIRATDLVSSEAEISASQLNDLASYVVDKKVKVIFQDNLKNPEVIRHLQESVKAKNWSVEISDKPLYADSLGESAPTNTYLGAFEYNINTIAEALTK